MRSTTLPPSGFFGSNATWASNFLNVPSTGTPICLLTNTIWLLSAISFAAGGSVAAMPGASIASKARGMKR